jgi:hypothetical protein
MLPWTSPKSASLSALSDVVFSWEKKNEIRRYKMIMMITEQRA